MNEMNEMIEYEQILDDCLQQIMRGEATVEDILRRYPAQAVELRPMLEAALGIRTGSEVAPSAAYKARARRQLMDYTQAHPRRRVSFSPLAMRLAIGVVVGLAVLLIAGTAYAQNSLPGDPLYNWKVTSEKAWRTVAPDPVAVDLSIANRRADELTLVFQQKAEGDRQAQAFQDYFQSLQQLQSDANPSDSGQILLLLETHKKQFQAAGIDDPQLDAILHGNSGNGGNGGNSGSGGGSGGGGGGSGGGGGGGGGSGGGKP